MRKDARVWLWDDAPAELRALSTQGGDEEYVVLVPGSPDWEGRDDHWFTSRTVERHRQPDGSLVLIVAH